MISDILFEFGDISPSQWH